MALMIIGTEIQIISFVDIREQLGESFFDVFYDWLTITIDGEQKNLMPQEISINKIVHCSVKHFVRFIKENNLEVNIEIKPYVY